MAAYRNRVANILPMRQKKRTPDKKERDDFYTSSAWRRLRVLFLRLFPLCAGLDGESCGRSAFHVHHKKPRLDFPELALDIDNLEGLCHSHHTILHNRERGGLWDSGKSVVRLDSAK